MKLPLFLPKELKECETAETGQELIQRLDTDDLLTFFECACEDETWTRTVGGETLKTLFSWLNDAYFQKELSREKAQKAMKAVQSHYPSVEPYFQKDLTIQVDSKSYQVSSFMFGGMSPFFHEKIREAYEKGKKRVISYSEIDEALFRFIEEGCYTGKLEYLWREEPETQLKLIKQASKWGLAFLEEYVADVYKRYINEKNIIELLSTARQESIYHLQRVCCEFVTSRQYGIELEAVNLNRIRLNVGKLSDKALQIIPSVASVVSFVTVTESASNSSSFWSLISEFSHLIGIDLSHTTSVLNAITELIPDVETIALSHCTWLNDEMMVDLTRRLQKTSDLDLSGNNQLTFRTWGALSELGTLTSVNVAYCRNTHADDIDLLASSCPNLIKLSLMGSENVNDEAVMSLVEQCNRLQELSLAHCPAITQEGLLSAAQQASNMMILDLRKSKSVNDQTLVQLVKIMPRLTSIDVTGCSVSFNAVEKSKQINSNVEITYR